MSVYADSRRVSMRITFGSSGIPAITSDKIVSAVVRQSVSPVAASLPSATLEAVVDNTDGMWDYANPDSYANALSLTQWIDVTFVIDGKNMSGGRFWLTRIEEGPQAKIIANDRIVQWGNEEYAGAENAADFRSALADVLAGGNYTYNFPSEIGSRTVRRSVRPGTTKREAIRQMCQAARCTCWTHGNNIFAKDFREFGTPVDALTADNMVSLENAAIKSLDSYTPVTKVIVKNAYGGQNVLGSGENPITVTAELASSGIPVATWLLDMYSQRIVCDCRTRGNPAVRVGDTITVDTRYGTVKVNVYDQVLTYNGGLSARIKGVGDLWSKSPTRQKGAQNE